MPCTALLSGERFRPILLIEMIAEMVEHKARDLQVGILVQVRIFLLKSENVISQGTNYKFVFTNQFDLEIIFSTS